MSKYDIELYGYGAGSLTFDSSTGKVRLSDGFDLSKDRIKFEIKDNDGSLDGDEKRNEQGEDSDQQGRATRSDGSEIEEGRIYSEEYFVLAASDGSQIRVDILEIGGTFVGYLPSAPLDPGAVYEEVERRDADNLLGGPNGDDTRTTYAEAQKNGVVCFGPGTMIMTQDGEIPVEWLDSTHKVLTRDRSFQPILWIGRTKLPQHHFDQFPQDRPVCIPAGTLGNKRPAHDLEVTGDHRMLICSIAADFLFAASEVFAPAKAWPEAGLAAHRTPKKPYTLTHILCPAHEVILANGAWVESVFPGPETLRRLSPQDRARVTGLLGPDYANMQTARHCLTVREAVSLLRLQHSPAVDVMPLAAARSA